MRRVVFAPGKNLMLVLLGVGVGGGLIIGGALVQGDDFTAGEIGHVVIDDEGEPCTRGKSGCREAAVSVSRLGPRLDAAGPDERHRLLRTAGRSLGVALAPIVAALGVKAITLAGPERFVRGVLLDEADTTIESRTLPAVARGVTDGRGDRPGGPHPARSGSACAASRARGLVIPPRDPACRLRGRTRIRDRADRVARPAKEVTACA